MKVYKTILKSKTAYFRNDVTSTSYQETFNCPPLSTIHGLIAAALGYYRYDVDIGYFFEYECKAVDYELIMRKDSSRKDIFLKYIRDNRFDRNDILRGCMGTIPIKREILFNCQLTLYLSDKEIAQAFECPFYSLLMGRSEDLAQLVRKSEMVELQDLSGPANIGGTIIPFEEAKTIPGRLSKMNIVISEDYPRVVKKVGIYNIIDKVWPKRDDLPPICKVRSRFKIGNILSQRT